MTEVELKMAFAPEGLQRLLAALPAVDSVREQHNHYLTDSAGTLSAAGVMVRVRESWKIEGDRHERVQIVLTTKVRTAAEGGVFVAIEHEQPLAPEIWDDFLASGGALPTGDGEALDWLRAHHPVADLVLIGKMHNRRHRVHVDGFELEIDRTTFPGGVIETEIEVETTDITGARALVADVARRAGIDLVEQTQGKYRRFLRYLADWR